MCITVYRYLIIIGLSLFIDLRSASRSLCADDESIITTNDTPTTISTKTFGSLTGRITWLKENARTDHAQPVAFAIVSLPRIPKEEWHPLYKKRIGQPLIIAIDSDRFRPTWVATWAGQEIRVANPTIEDLSFQFDRKWNTVPAGGSLIVSPLLTSHGENVFLHMRLRRPESICSLIVNDNPYFSVTSKTGDFTLSQVPVGRHRLQIHYLPIGLLHGDEITVVEDENKSNAEENRRVYVTIQEDMPTSIQLQINSDR